ncbi:MAG: DUF805 domain-containing protein [Prevotella sp.]|nr:DUF805 domain-containing protein [Prevotella sp.]MCM1074894.1 DUF805 domain-containing protein [Ruminococcus sp.]
MMNQYQVSFGDAVKRAFSQYCKFTGRASRSEYWWFYLFNVIASCVIFFICGGTHVLAHAWDVAMSRGGDVNVEYGGTYSTISYIWSLVTLLPGLGLFWRRMHDAGHSGWWWLWTLLPLIGWIIILVALCKPSVPAENQYGPVPNTGAKY